ncbi:MAG: hypothetical protein EOM80_02220 [Erysipelotrichia bacterium]|nr:hypothetical protein [Erysipelotrichia bacterium]
MSFDEFDDRFLPWNFASLAKELFMSSSEIHAGFKRAIKANLVNGMSRKPNCTALAEFLIHGISYVFPAERGEMTRGIPTAHAVPPLKNMLANNENSCPVWPDSKGRTWGQTFMPLYKSVPKAAMVDPRLYELLALVDAIRGGRAREKNLAVKELKQRLGVD